MNQKRTIISMFEHKKDPILPKHQFAIRVVKALTFALFILVFSLGLGIWGYHFICHQSWIDALLNASMILTGMGPVNILTTFSGKLFASFYAIFSGVAFLSMASVLISPFFHRFLHFFHVDLD